MQQFGIPARLLTLKILSLRTFHRTVEGFGDYGLAPQNFIAGVLVVDRAEGVALLDACAV